MTKHIQAISIPPQLPLLRKAKPTPVPQIIAPKIQFNIMSSTIGAFNGGKMDNKTAWMIKDKIVLKQNFQFKIFKPNTNKGILIAKLMRPVKSTFSEKGKIPFKK